jgi:large subunit ribosomal protein L25
VADYQLAIERRSDKGKGVARKLRAAGRIPGVFYTSDASAHPIALDPRALENVIATSSAGMNTLIDLSGGGELDGKLVLVKDVQRDPIRGTLLHADLYGVDVTRTIQVSVPVHLEGNPTGVVNSGGIMDHALREVELSCLPGAIPEELRLDVSGLDLGDSFHVRDIALPESVVLVSDSDLPVVSVVAPRVEEEAKPAEEEEDAEGVEAAAAEGEAAPAAEASEGGGESKSEG